MARFIGGSSWRAVLLSAAYVVAAGFIAAAAIAFVGIDGGEGFVASAAITCMFIAPLWLYAKASDRTPVSEIEIDETIAEAEVAAAALPGATDHDAWDTAEMVRGHFGHLLWRLAEDAPRRGEIVAAEARLEQAMSEALQDSNTAQP